jgi:uncharacterized protein YdaU (DUF1376 family)
MSIPSMPLFCGDYLADTKHLTLEQHGAYCLLLMITWRNNGRALPDDDGLLARYLAITKDRWLKKIRPALAPLFDLTGGTWRSVRLEREWEYVRERIAAQRANGAKGGRPPKNGPNGPDFQASSRENFSENGDANTLKNNETTKPNGFSSLNPTETTQPHTSPAYAEEEGGGTRAHEVAVLVGGLTGLTATKANVATVEEWLAKGYDPQQDVYPAVVKALPTAKTAPGTFAYFTGPIARRHAARISPHSNVSYLPSAAGGRQAPSDAMSRGAQDLMAAWTDPNFDYGMRR